MEQDRFILAHCLRLGLFDIPDPGNCFLREGRRVNCQQGENSNEGLSRSAHFASSSVDEPTTNESVVYPISVMRIGKWKKNNGYIEVNGPINSGAVADTRIFQKNLLFLQIALQSTLDMDEDICKIPTSNAVSLSEHKCALNPAVSERCWIPQKRPSDVKETRHLSGEALLNLLNILFVSDSSEELSQMGRCY
jgi:hypothetical protein